MSTEKLWKDFQKVWRTIAQGNLKKIHEHLAPWKQNIKSKKYHNQKCIFWLLQVQLEHAKVKTSHSFHMLYCLCWYGNYGLNTSDIIQLHIFHFTIFCLSFSFFIMNSWLLLISFLPKEVAKPFPLCIKNLQRQDQVGINLDSSIWLSHVILLIFFISY